MHDKHCSAGKAGEAGEDWDRDWEEDERKKRMMELMLAASRPPTTLKSRWAMHLGTPPPYTKSSATFGFDAD